MIKIKLRILIFILFLLFLLINNIHAEEKIYLKLEDNTILENQTIINYNYIPYPRQVGIAVHCNNSIIRNCTIAGFYINMQIMGKNNIIENNNILSACDGIQVGENSKNTIVRNNYFNRNNWSICCWMNNSDTTIENNSFINSLDAALDIRNCTNTIVRNNYFADNLFNFIHKKSQPYHNLKIYNNTFENNKFNITDFDGLWRYRHYGSVDNTLNNNLDEINDIYKNKLDDCNNVKNILFFISIFAFIVIAILSIKIIKK